MPLFVQASRFASLSTSKPESFEILWPDDLNSWSEGRKEDQALFSLAVFKPGKGRGKGETEANIQEVSGIVLDYDEEHRISVETACAAWQGYEFVAYSTHRHTAQAPRFRIVIPFQTPLNTLQFNVVKDNWLRNFLQSAGASVTLHSCAQIYYLPSRPVGAIDWFFKYHQGQLLDPLSFMPGLDRAEPAEVEKPVLVASPSPLLEKAKQKKDGPREHFSGISRAHEVANLAAIEQHCNFMRHCREDAQDLKEPEWHSWLSILSRCKRGSKEAHTIGSAHPGYSRSETDAKLQRVLDESAPHTCDVISERSKACEGCPLKGKIASPISIHYLVQNPTADTLDTEELAERAQAQTTIHDELKSTLKMHESALASAEKALAVHELRMASKRKNLKGSRTLADVADFDAEELEFRVERTRLKNEVVKAKKTVAATKAKITLWSDAVEADPQVGQKLQRDGHYQPRSNSYNLLTIFQEDAKYKNLLRYNLFSRRVYVGEEAISDTIVTRYAAEIERRYQIPSADFRAVARAMEAVAYDNAYHPVVQYLEALSWDGIGRLHDLMPRGLGAPHDDAQTAQYLLDVGKKFAIACVARVLSPEKKNEVVVVLTGAQGKGKSRAFETLAVNAEWFSDTRLPVGDKDAFLQLQGKWIYEIAEMDSFKGKEASTVKGFISSRADNYRAPYDKYPGDVRRQTVLVGSTNEPQFLDDPSGSRRFAPVRVGKPDLKWLKENVHQIWAEAVVRFRNGEQWWYAEEDGSSEQLRKASEVFQMSDPWEATVADHVMRLVAKEEKRHFLTVLQMLREVIGVQEKDIDKRHSNRMASVLRKLCGKLQRMSPSEAKEAQEADAKRRGQKPLPGPAYRPWGHWVDANTVQKWSEGGYKDGFEPVVVDN